MKLSNDSFALFLLCSHLGLPTSPSQNRSALENGTRLNKSSRPTHSTWRSCRVQARRRSSRLFRLRTTKPRGLPGCWTRSGVIEQELERLSELGIWVITRFDEDYPPRFNRAVERLRPRSSSTAQGAPRLLNRRGLAVVGSRNIDQRGVALTEFIATHAPRRSSRFIQAAREAWIKRRWVRR